MKRAYILLMCLGLSGCVSTYVIKEIKVKKDANGKVVETVETERTIQQGITRGMQFDYLKNKEGDQPGSSALNQHVERFSCGALVQRSDRQGNNQKEAEDQEQLNRHNSGNPDLHYFFTS